MRVLTAPYDAKKCLITMRGIASSAALTGARFRMQQHSQSCPLIAAWKLHLDRFFRLPWQQQRDRIKVTADLWHAELLVEIE